MITPPKKVTIQTINILVLGSGQQVLTGMLLNNEMSQLPFEKFYISSKDKKYRESISRLVGLQP